MGEPGSSFYSTVIGLGNWSLIELALGITAASLATLRPLFRRFLQPIRATIQERSATPVRKLRKARCSNDRPFASVKKGSISKPYDAASNSSQVSLWNGLYSAYGPPSAASTTGTWDKATLLESQSPHWESKLDRDSLATLSPPPKITPNRSPRGGEVVRHDELFPGDGDQRNSVP